MIKISIGIAYEQNRPTGVTSALRGQFSFWAKKCLKKALHKNFLKTKVVTNHNTQLLVRKLFDSPKGVASVLMA